jgi:hypothetical protein
VAATPFEPEHDPVSGLHAAVVDEAPWEAVGRDVAEAGPDAPVAALEAD